MPPDQRDKVIKRKSMFIDIGARDKEHATETLGVRIGDPIVPQNPFRRLGDKKFILSKAWDDRIGCALMIDVIKKFAKTRHPNTLFGVGTVQEEVGLRGAQTSAAVVDPDVGFALEVGIAHDTPGFGTDDEEALGAGVAIYVFDRSMIPNRNLLDLVIDTATRKKIPFYLASIPKGGTDSGRIHLNGAGVEERHLDLAVDQQDLRKKILSAYRQSALMPPYFRELAKTLKVTPDQVQGVLQLLLREGHLIKVKEDLYYHHQVLEKLKTQLVAHIQEKGEISTPEFKDMTGASRKYVIPLLEHLVTINFTIRIGDIRKLRKR